MYLSSRFSVFLCFIVQCLQLAYGSVITLENNGYKGIVVAIHKDVPEDLELLENIKTLFTRASAFLHNSTKNTFYFKEVKIIVPSTWSSRPEYHLSPGNYFTNAHIRVDAPNPEYSDTPYTIQPGGCGEPGLYIHLTPWFLKELHGKTVEMFGAPERQLIHEWAHLRYGVFDEYGVPGSKRYPMFYHENGRIRPTSCVRDIKGWIESRDGGPCMMTESGEVDRDCIFIPNMSDNEAKASIMYMPFIPSMEGFCDSDHYLHNVLAPTKHNAVCNYRSTWDIISTHSDYQKRAKRDTKEQELTETLFQVIQSRPTSRCVLLLDISGSMNGQPMKLLHGAATRLIEDRVQDGSYLGIVQFSTKARILRNLTKVNNVTRKQLSKSLPSKDDGGRTAIGQGLIEALKVLTNGNDTTEGGLIMLITDGEENVTPFIEDVLPDILKYKVIINAVAFGSDASQKLETITAVTGGRGYFFSNNGTRPASALDSAFLESITSQADIELQPVQLKNEIITLDTPNVRKFVYIDKELGKDTKFTLTSHYLDRVSDIVLRSPTGNITDASSPLYSRDDKTGQRIEIAVPEAEPGKWEIVIRRIGDHPVIVSFSVTSEPKDIRDQPIRVRSWLSDIQLKFPAYAKIFAEVKKGYLAVVGAEVIATVERPVDPTIDVELRDDGLGADVTENDGIYTAYFTHFNGNGRYAVIARVVNGGHARLKHGSSGSASIRIPKSKATAKSKDVPPSNEFSVDDFVKDDRNQTDEDIDEDSEPASSFDRYSDCGALRLDSYDPHVGDVIPPGDITDLIVIASESKEDHYMVSLTFTTPGDDLNDGQVDDLELRASRSKSELITTFESGLMLNETFVVNGSLIPLPPGETGALTIVIPKDLFGEVSEPWSLYFAMKAIDEIGNVSCTFNVAEATFGKIILKSASSVFKETETTTFKKESAKNFGGHEQNVATKANNNDDMEENSTPGVSKWWPVIVGIGIVITVIIILALITVIIIKKTRVKAYFSVQSEQC